MKKIQSLNTIRSLIGMPKSENVFLSKKELHLTAQMLGMDEGTVQTMSAHRIWENLIGESPTNAFTPPKEMLSQIIDLFYDKDGGAGEVQRALSSAEESRTRGPGRPPGSKNKSKEVPSQKRLDILALVTTLPKDFKEMVSEVNWNITENTITIKLK